MKLYLIIAIFILMNGFFIISNNDLKMDNAENISKFILIYGEWIDRISNNLSTISGNVVKMDWTPQNSSTG